MVADPLQDNITRQNQHINNSSRYIAISLDFFRNFKSFLIWHILIMGEVFSFLYFFHSSNHPDLAVAYWKIFNK